MARKTNYGFQKRQKEAEQQKKREGKAARKRARREAADEAASTREGAESGEEPPRPEPSSGAADLDPQLRARLQALCEEGWALWCRFDDERRRHSFHPFVPADHQAVLEALIPLRAPGLRFLEWGSATGVITIMADLLGFEAYGIELDPDLVDQARELARKRESRARFTVGSFIPAGYRWKDHRGDERLGTIGHGDSGYLDLGLSLEDFDVVYGYPWSGEELMMLDLMKVHGRPDATLLVHAASGVDVYRGGRLAA